MTVRLELMRLGQLLVARSVIVGDETAINEMVDESMADEPFVSDHHRQMIFHDLYFALCWARCGLPQIVPTHRFAASMMATSVAADAVHDVIFPWYTFAVVIPNGLITVRSSSGREWQPESVWVYPNPQGGVAVVIRSDHSSIILRTVDTAADLALAASLDRFVEYGVPASEDKEISAWNERAMMMLYRLVLGVCVELDSPKHKIVIGNGRPVDKRAKRGEPKAWTFVLSRDVQVDCREWATRYLHGEDGTKRSVQTLVRGHHKRQAHGPGGELRKWIHVEPYWRGPDDAPIAVSRRMVVR